MDGPQPGLDMRPDEGAPGEVPIQQSLLGEQVYDLIGRGIIDAVLHDYAPVPDRKDGVIGAAVVAAIGDCRAMETSTHAVESWRSRKSCTIRTRRL